MGITLGCVLLFIGIFGVYRHRQKRNRISNQKTISPRRDQSVRAQNVPMTSIHRNAPRTNGNHVAYTIPMSTVFASHAEELPPSYETFISSLTTQEQSNSNRYWYKNQFQDFILFKLTWLLKKCFYIVSFDFLIILNFFCIYYNLLTNIFLKRMLFVVCEGTYVSK